MGALALVVAVLTPVVPRADKSGPDLAASTVERIHVAGSVYMLRINAPVANPSTVASIGSDGALLVDTGFTEAGPALAASLREVAPGPVKYVINTHPHGDHTSGNQYFGSTATIVGRSNLRQRVSTEPLLGPESAVMSPVGWPDITTDARLTIHFNGEAVEVIPLSPGHTDGDFVVYFPKSRVLAVGDYYFTNRYPIIDLGSGGSFGGYFRNIKWMLNHFPADTKVIPGHSTFEPAAFKPATMAEYRAWCQRIEASIAYIVAQRKAGQSAEQITSAGLPERFAALGQRPRFVKPAAWISFVYKNAP